jgi:hypothetical protein
MIFFSFRVVRVLVWCYRVIVLHSFSGNNIAVKICYVRDAERFRVIAGQPREGRAVAPAMMRFHEANIVHSKGRKAIDAMSNEVCNTLTDRSEQAALCATWAGGIGWGCYGELHIVSRLVEQCSTGRFKVGKHSNALCCFGCVVAGLVRNRHFFFRLVSK